MFIVGKSFFSKTLSKFNIKTIAPLCVIHIPYKMLAVGPLGPQYCCFFVSGHTPSLDKKSSVLVFTMR